MQNLPQLSAASSIPAVSDRGDGGDVTLVGHDARCKHVLVSGHKHTSQTGTSPQTPFQVPEQSFPRGRATADFSMFYRSGRKAVLSDSIPQPLL